MFTLVELTQFGCGESIDILFKMSMGESVTAMWRICDCDFLASVLVSVWPQISQVPSV